MIEIKNVTKYFDDVVAVDHVSVAIKEKNVFGLIGTNGAGKSTVLRLITGDLYRLSAGVRQPGGKEKVFLYSG